MAILSILYPKNRCYLVLLLAVFFIILLSLWNLPNLIFVKTIGGCDVTCKVGIPCEYNDEVDLRIMVLTFNRPKSLEKCLAHIHDLDTLGDKAAVHIWVDRGKSGDVDPETVNIAQNFSNSWSQGQACVHIRERNAYIMGQWIDSWRPKPNTSEIGLILEDDIDISPLAYRWLKNVHKHFKGVPDVAGYALQMENIQTKRGTIRRMQGPEADVVYLYAAFCTWGFAPNPKIWREFQDWFHYTCDHDREFRPYVPDLISTRWFKEAELENKADSVWEMWFTYYCNAKRRFTVHPNLLAYTGRQDVLLDTNRQERGLHFNGEGVSNNDRYLLREWDVRFERFPEIVKRFGYDGKPT